MTGERLPYDFAPLVVTSFLIGFANAISHGRYLGPALIILVVAMGVLGWRLFASSRARAEHAPQGRVALVARGVVVLLLVSQFGALLDPKLVSEPHGSILLVRAAEIGSILLVLSYVPFLGARRETARMADARFWAFGALVAVAGATALHAAPAPGIDVWTIQMEGARELLHGHNPYVTATVPDTDPENTFVVPYVYPPTAIYVGALGLLLGGDVRWALLVAMLVTGFALRSIARQPESKLPTLLHEAPALFFWLTPLLVFVLDSSWIDPVQVMLVTLGVMLHVKKRPLATAIVLGIAASSKQSMFWLVPLAVFVLRIEPRHWPAFALAAALPLAPFVLLDFARLKYCLFDFMSALPPRMDALDVAVFFHDTFGLPFPGAAGFVLAAASVAFALARMRWSTAGFARAVAFTYFVFFLFNRWAFANYYFLLTSLAALAAATTLARAPATR